MSKKWNTDEEFVILMEKFLKENLEAVLLDHKPICIDHSLSKEEKKKKLMNDIKISRTNKFKEIFGVSQEEVFGEDVDV